MGIFGILEAAADEHGDRTAVVSDGLELTYAQVLSRSSRLAGHLRSVGIGPGDRVAILERNTHRFLEAYFGVAAAGAVLTPLNVRLSSREIGAILEDCGARRLLAGPEFREALPRWLGGASPLEGATVLDDDYERALAAVSAPPPPHSAAPGDVAHLYYTSGTTGRPKGVMLTHRNVTLHADLAIEELSIRGSDVWAHVAPMFHLADAWATFALTRVGGRHVMVPKFDAARVLETFEREGITITNLIPTMLNLMIRDESARGRDYRSLRLLLSGGAPIAPEVVRATIATFGCEYVQTYGMTETSPYLTLSLLPDHLRALPPEERLAFQAKTGRPMKGVELEVTDEAGNPVARDGREVGEIRVRGETITPGYWNRPRETRAAFRDGWLLTGDLAVVDAEGFVNIVDRAKDMILCGGENVYSVEVENVLYENPKVLEAAAFGVPDELFGEAVRAAIVLRPGVTATADELLAFARERLAAYKVPKSVVFLEELPKTGTGKITKRALRERYG